MVGCEGLKVLELGGAGIRKFDSAGVRACGCAEVMGAAL